MLAVVVDGRECPRPSVPRWVADEVAEVVGPEANRLGTAADVAVVPWDQDFVDEVVAVQPKVDPINILLSSQWRSLAFR